MGAFQIPSDLLGLEDQVALVTGAGAGIGRGIAMQLARAGCHVAVVDVNEEAGKRTAQDVRVLGRRAIYLPVDVRRLEEVKAMVDRTCAELGGLDIGVNNVGGPVAIASVLDFTPEQWDAANALNIKATLFCAQAEAISMIERGVKGRIINVASTSGVTGAPTICAYGAAKAGVIHLSRTMALELAAYDIRVNCLVPGTHLTETIRKTLDTGGPQASFLQAAAKGTPMQRLGEPEEAGGVAVFLASNLSSYMTGQFVISDGGISITTNRPSVGAAALPKALAHIARLQGGR